MIITPIDGATTVSEGSASIARRNGDFTSVQVDISGGTATVDIYARLDRSMGWIKMGASLTASALQQFTFAHEWRYDITAISGATVKVAVTGEST